MSGFQIINPIERAQQFCGMCALGIMTKAPEAGKVKTRLTPPLTPAEAAALNICFLRDLARSIDEATEHAPACGVAIFTPVGRESAYEKILPQSFLMIPRRGDGFGERLALAVNDLLTAGFESVCLINSDSPTVPAANFAEAANELAKSGDRVVLGPSDDGGYYLIGLKVPHQEIFQNIDWSTERVLEQTIERAGEINVPVHRLATSFDVDDRATLQRLCEELLDSNVPAEVAPDTRQFLKQIVEREGPARICPAI